MISEKLEKRLENISAKFIEMGFSLKEDLFDLVEERPDIGEKIENTKLKKIEFFNDPERNSVGFTLDDAQVEFVVETGEDEEGPWYEATAEVRLFGE